MAIYKLTLTEDQAQIVATACEFFARVKMGQFREIVWHCAENHCPRSPGAAEQAWLELRKQLYPDLDGAGHSYGIGKYADADKAFGVYEVIRHAMGDRREPFSYYPLPEIEKGR